MIDFSSYTAGDKMMVRQLQRGLILVLLMLGLCAPVVQAGAKPNFMTVDVAVANYSPKALQQALKQALAQVLIRISGNPSVMTLPQVQNQLDHVNRMVTAYSYQTADNAQGQAVLQLRVAFIDHAIKHLLRAAGQPVWNANRPTTLVWLRVSHQGDAGDMVAADSVGSSPVATALGQDARARGLSLIFPMLDLDDQSQLASSRADQVLNVSQMQQASERYHVTSMLSGSVHEVGGHWQADWLYMLDGAPIRWQDEADSVELLTSQAISNLASSMTSQLAMASPEQGDGSILLHVTDINDLSQYAMVQEYLQNLAPVNNVSLQTVDPDELVLHVRFQGQLSELKKAIVAGHEMSASDADWLRQDNSPNLVYRWVGGVG